MIVMGPLNSNMGSDLSCLEMWLENHRLDDLGDIFVVPRYKIMSKIIGRTLESFSINIVISEGLEIDSQQLPRYSQ